MSTSRWLAELFWSCSDHGLSSESLECEDCEQDMEVFAAGLTVAEAGLNVSKAAKRCYGDYRGADRDILLARYEDEQLQLNQTRLDLLPLPKKQVVEPARASLHDLQAAISIPSQPQRKWERLKWALSHKSDFENQSAQIKRSQSSLIVGLLLDICQEFERQRQDLAKWQRVLNIHCEASRKPVRTSELSSRTYTRERRSAQICDWSIVAKLLDIRVCVIRSSAGKGSTWNIFARWPLRLPFGCGRVLTGRMFVHSFLPSVPTFGLKPQNTIAPDSEIIEACQKCDLTKVRRIMSQKQAHPNDRTPTGLTVFRHAVRSGNVNIVQLLLDSNADPNLPFGEFETSPLNNAFLIGNVEIIRRLLNAKAELDYLNKRSWTSLSFLWEPGRPTHSSTCEILDICMNLGFSAWNLTDPEGWSLCHRAGAYGSGDDVRSLHHKGGNMQSYTTDFYWGPITCAVWNSNESTFDALVELLPLSEVIGVRDARGWTLLHFAAQNGCRHILKRLLTDFGADREALTDGTQYWVKEGLDYKRLTAETLAREYGHGAIWDDLIKQKEAPESGSGSPCAR